MRGLSTSLFCCLTFLRYSRDPLLGPDPPVENYWFSTSIKMSMNDIDLPECNYLVKALDPFELKLKVFLFLLRSV